VEATHRGDAQELVLVVEVEVEVAQRAVSIWDDIHATLLSPHLVILRRIDKEIEIGMEVKSTQHERGRVRARARANNKKGCIVNRIHQIQ